MQILIKIHLGSYSSEEVEPNLTKMKCQVNSKEYHHVLISKEINFESYKEICSGEPRRVNLGFNNDPKLMNVDTSTNTILAKPQSCDDFPHKPNPDQTFNPCVHGARTNMARDWEILSTFLSIHNFEPTWLDCGMSWGWYDEDLGGWTGCMGKV